MKITIDIPAVENLATAITKLAEAYSEAQPRTLELFGEIEEISDQCAKKSTTINSLDGSEIGVVTQMSHEPNQDIETPSEKTELTPAEKRKLEISKEIVALGGTPPERGAVSKFEKALDDLKSANEEVERECPTPTEEATTQEDPEVEDAPEDTASTEIPTLDEVRIYARHVVTNQPDGDTALGKTKMRACLNKVGAENITQMFETMPEKVNEFVTLLAKNTDKTLAEAVAEASA